VESQKRAKSGSLSNKDWQKAASGGANGYIFNIQLLYYRWVFSSTGGHHHISAYLISMPARQPTAWGIYLYYKCSAFSVFKMIGWKPIETPMSIFNRRVS